MLSVIFSVSVLSLMGVGFGINVAEERPQEVQMEVKNCVVKMPVITLKHFPLQQAGKPFADCTEHLPKKREQEEIDLHERKSI